MNTGMRSATVLAVVVSFVVTATISGCSYTKKEIEKESVTPAPGPPTVVVNPAR